MQALARNIKEVILKHKNKPLTKDLAKLIAKELIRDVGIGIEGEQGTRNLALLNKQLVESLLRARLLSDEDNPVITELLASERSNNMATGWEELGYK